jgi:hypothetical protein
MTIVRRDDTAKIVIGAAAGLAATVPMTLAMEAMYRRLPWTQREPLPPRKITERALAAIGVRHKLDEEERFALTMVNHFGYGTAMGGIYGPASDRVKGTPVVKGMGFGLIVWAGSYLGLLPALGLMQPATRHRPHRNALMIVAHLVWGATLGLLTAWWSSHATQQTRTPRATQQRAPRGRSVRVATSRSTGFPPVHPSSREKQSMG